MFTLILLLICAKMHVLRIIISTPLQVHVLLAIILAIIVPLLIVNLLVLNVKRDSKDNSLITLAFAPQNTLIMGLNPHARLVLM